MSKKAISALPASVNANGDLSLRLLAVLDAQKIGVWEFRADSSCVYLSSFAVSAFGVNSPCGEMPFDDFLLLLPAEQAKALRFTLAKCILEGTRFSFELALGGRKQLLEGTSFQDGHGRSRVTALLLTSDTVGKSEPELSSLEGLKVVALDDCEDSRYLVRAILESSGAQVLLADSAQTALSLVRKERPNLIISDLGMPEQDGFAFIKTVRSLPAEQGGVTPAIAVSGYDEPEDIKRALSAGFQNHLAKPIDPDTLLSCAIRTADRRANATCHLR